MKCTKLVGRELDIFGFRRTLVGLKFDVGIEDRLKRLWFQTHPCGVEVIGRWLLGLGKVVSDAPLWG